MGVLAADSDGCCVARTVMSRRLFFSSSNLGICLCVISQSQIYKRMTGIREALSNRFDISSAVKSQAGGGL
jgi:hypothetical protein